MRRTVPPSAEIEARIEHMLSVGVGESPRESLSELARLGARLIIQRAVEDEFDAWLGRARYERRPRDQSEERGEESGLRNGFRSRRVQTAEGELSIEIPQVRQAAETFASKLFPRTPKLLRTEPLKALVIGAFVRGLSMRDVESLCEQAGLGKLSKSTASRMCEELEERFERFRRRDLYEIHLEVKQPFARSRREFTRLRLRSAPRAPARTRVPAARAADASRAPRARRLGRWRSRRG